MGGEDMVVSRALLRVTLPCIALVYVEVLSLTREDLMCVLEFHPDVSLQVRKAGILMAFRRAVQIFIEERNARQLSLSAKWIHDLFGELGLTAKYDSSPIGSKSLHRKKQ